MLSDDEDGGPFTLKTGRRGSPMPGEPRRAFFLELGGGGASVARRQSRKQGQGPSVLPGCPQLPPQCWCCPGGCWESEPPDPGSLSAFFPSYLPAGAEDGMSQAPEARPCPTSVYHERQRLELCAVHALNNVLQQRLFSQEAADEICKR